MKDIDTLLQGERPVPRRALSSDFTTRVISEIINGKAPSRLAIVKEMVTMKVMKNPVAMVAVGIVLFALLGGGTYAAFHQFSLQDMYDGLVPSSHHSDKQMQQIYKQYIDDASASKATAFDTFSHSVTSDLLKKLNTQRNTGYDPIVCGNNLPKSVAFKTVDELGGRSRATLHYDSGDVIVGLSYSNETGLFTDIVCPSVSEADGIAAMQGYYNEYYMGALNISRDPTLATINDPYKEFTKHVTPDLAKKLDALYYAQPFPADGILCVQNYPSMIEFADVTSTGMTVVEHFSEGSAKIKVSYNLRTQKFTDIDCNV